RGRHEDASSILTDGRIRRNARTHGGQSAPPARHQAGLVRVAGYRGEGEMTQTLLWEITFWLVIASWFAFIFIFFSRKRPPKAKEAKRVSTSFGAIALQGMGFAAAWSLRRPSFTPIFPAAMPVQVVMAIFTVALAVMALSLVSASVRTLGKQWALVA